MHTIFSRLRAEFSFINTRAATENDFYSFCRLRGIETVFRHEIRNGIYARIEGSDFMFFNSSLYGSQLLYVMFHEVGHYLFHAPTRARNAISFFDDTTRRRNHAEAEATAAYLLLPADDLKNNLIYRSPCLAKLIALRIDLYNRYGN